jgi:hypothetical protein
MATADTVKKVIQYHTTKGLLDCVVRWLKTEPSPNDAEWQAHTDVVESCLEKMVEMSVNPSKDASSGYVQRPVADVLNRAMPHVRSALTAMWDRDRTMALAHGETASAALSLEVHRQRARL